MKFKLNLKQISLLEDEFGISPADIISKHDIDNIINKLGVLFTEKGLKPNSEPNEYGIMIDDIIGIFSQEYYK